MTKEGERIRRLIDLPLVRSNSPAFILSWTVMHPITPDSPLHNATRSRSPARRWRSPSPSRDSMTPWGQTIHARHSYVDHELVWNARMVDIIRVEPDGRRIVDYRRFHDVEPLPPPQQQQA